MAPEVEPGKAERGDGLHDRTFGEYQIQSEIARGGMGVIYKARHSRLNRWVALKVMVGGEFASADFKQRFRTEAQAAAALEHPNIIPIYEVGEEDGQPYFSMKLVEAGTLTSKRPAQERPIYALRDESPAPGCKALAEPGQVTGEKRRLQALRASAAAVMKLARAVQFAHERGVLHRDLKPNNVLVDSTGELFLTDFGLAKLVEKEASLTKTMAVLGTPSYMAPEQARGDTRHITTAADVYGLGAILYELIAGRPPFTGQSPIEIIKQVLEREPAAPSVAARKDVGGVLPADAGNAGRDLDTICLKCLEKEPSRRYASARALAEDLERWLNHEPIHARQASMLERVGKWVRRKPAWAGLIATVVFSLLALGAGSVWFTAQVMKARTTAERANGELSRNLFIRELMDAESLLDEGKIPPALAWFARAAREHPADVAVQTRLLSLLTERHFVLPVGPPLIHGSPVNNAAFLSDGQHLVTASGDGLVRVWPLNPASQPLILSNRFERPAVAALSRPNLLLVDESRSISLWNLNQLVQFVPLAHDVSQWLAISPDGQLAGIYDRVKGLHLWDAGELKPVGKSFEEIAPYPSVTGFSPDGKYLLGTDKSPQIFAWEIASGRLVWQSPKSPGFRGEGVVRAVVHPGGARVITSCWLGASGGELSGWTFNPSSSTNAPPATASSEGWVLRTPVIDSWCFSRDGNELYVGDAEGHLGMVNLTSHELHPLNGEHDGRVTWMGLSPDGKRLATSSTDGTARLWDARMKSPNPVVIANGESVWDAKFSPDSQWFVCSGTGAVEIRDARSASLLRRLPLNQFVTRMDISPDGRRVVACGVGGQTTVWDALTGAPLFPSLVGGSDGYVEFSRDGRRFLVASGKATVEVHETETGRQFGPTLTNTSTPVAATFSVNGDSLFVGTDNGTVEFWSILEGIRRVNPAHHKDVVWTVRLSPDGTQLLTASRDRTAALWDAESGRLIREFRHEQQVYNATFSPDGARIVTGGASRKAYLWDARTGQLLFSLPAHPGGVWYGEFSSDGRVLLTGDDAGNARLWEASSGLPLSDWVHNGSSLKRIHLSPDGRMALSASNDGTVRLWPVLLAPLPAPTWLADLAEAVAGRRLRRDGAPESVPAEGWQALRDSLLSKEENSNFYTRWLHWFFVERLSDKPSEFK